MIDTILLVDDESLFHLVFEDACSLLDISISLRAISTVEEAERLFKGWLKGEGKRPECVFVDYNLIGSRYDGIELVRKINTEFGNHVVIGIISSSSDKTEIEKARNVGAQFWIVKSDAIEPRLARFRDDYPGYRERTRAFEVYR